MRALLLLLLLSGCATVPKECPEGQSLERVSMPVPGYRKPGGVMNRGRTYVWVCRG